MEDTEDIGDRIMEDMDLEDRDLDQFRHRHRDCSHHRLRQIHLCRLRHDHIADVVDGKRHILVCRTLLNLRDSGVFLLVDINCKA